MRDRLLDALDRAAALPVPLVAAPAGYGKTTLVAQWLASGRAPAAAWVALDATDDDPRRLWTHVALALEQAGCPVADDLDALPGRGRARRPGRRAAPDRERAGGARRTRW